VHDDVLDQAQRLLADVADPLGVGALRQRAVAREHGLALDAQQQDLVPHVADDGAEGRAVEVAVDDAAEGGGVAAHGGELGGGRAATGEHEGDAHEVIVGRQQLQVARGGQRAQGGGGDRGGARRRGLGGGVRRGLVGLVGPLLARAGGEQQQGEGRGAAHEEPRSITRGGRGARDGRGAITGGVRMCREYGRGCGSLRGPMAPRTTFAGPRALPTSPRGEPLWLAAGAAVVGVLFGGAAVFLGLQQPMQAPVVAAAPDPLAQLPELPATERGGRGPRRRRVARATR
jgi:hypothetical protein